MRFTAINLSRFPMQMMEELMRSTIHGMVLVAGIGLAGVPAVSASPITGGVRDATALEGLVEHVQYESRHCRGYGVHAKSKTFAARPVKGTVAAIAKSAGVGADG